MKFVFKTIDGANITECSESFAHTLLSEYAKENGLSLHVHPGSWTADTAASIAYTKGGDMLLDAVAVVRVQREATPKFVDYTDPRVTKK